MNDFNHFITLVDSITAGGGTNLFDAIYVGIESLKKIK